MSRKLRVFPEQGRSVQDRRRVRVTALLSQWQRKGEMFTFFTEILFFNQEKGERVTTLIILVDTLKLDFIADTSKLNHSVQEFSSLQKKLNALIAILAK